MELYYSIRDEPLLCAVCPLPPNMTAGIPTDPNMMNYSLVQITIDFYISWYLSFVHMLPNTTGLIDNLKAIHRNLNKGSFVQGVPISFVKDIIKTTEHACGFSVNKLFFSYELASMGLPMNIGLPNILASMS